MPGTRPDPSASAARRRRPHQCRCARRPPGRSWSPAATTRGCGCGTWMPEAAVPAVGSPPGQGQRGRARGGRGRPIAISGGNDRTVRVWDLKRAGRWVGRWWATAVRSWRWLLASWVAARSRSPAATTTPCGSGTWTPGSWSTAACGPRRQRPGGGHGDPGRPADRGVGQRRLHGAGMGPGGGQTAWWARWKATMTSSTRWPSGSSMAAQSRSRVAATSWCGRGTLRRAGRLGRAAGGPRRLGQRGSARAAGRPADRGVGWLRQAGVGVGPAGGRAAG